MYFTLKTRGKASPRRKITNLLTYLEDISTILVETVDYVTCGNQQSDGQNQEN